MLIGRAEIETKVRNAPGPVLLDFYQASCAPCRTLDPLLKRLALEYAGRVPVYRVDLELDLEVAKMLNVMSLPTILVVKDGRELIRLDGLIKEQDLRAALEKASRCNGAFGA